MKTLWLTTWLMLFFGLGLASCGRRQEGTSAPARNAAQAVSSPTAASTAPAPAATDSRLTSGELARKVFKTGQAVPVGYLGYKVQKSWFADKLAENKTAKARTGESYLLVEMAIVNTDRKPRRVPALKVVDENQKEFGTSDTAKSVEGSVGAIDQLEPGMSKRVLAIFEVPANRQYRLKIPGFSSSDEAIIELLPVSITPFSKPTPRQLPDDQ